MTARGAKRHLVSLANPGTAVPDGDGSFTQVDAPLTPATAWAEIKPATARDLERTTSGTVLSEASHIVTMDYHPGVSTQTRITFNGRTLNVTGVSNPEEKNVELILTAEEVVA